MCLRELEGLIFDCVLYMDELKQQITEDLLSGEPSPTPARSSSPPEGRENLTHPQVRLNNTTKSDHLELQHQIFWCFAPLENTRAVAGSSTPGRCNHVELHPR